MKLLIIKMSSMGDVIHTMPALTEAMQHIPDLEVDWVVETAFAEIPRWHPSVRRILPISLRFWRKHLVESKTFGEAKQFINQLKSKKYDVVIDAQGLMKSALVTRFTSGERHGYDVHSIREKFASYFYTHPHAVSRQLHAVERIRQLFGQALHYEPATEFFDYGLKLQPSHILNKLSIKKPYVVLLHGTTWETKEWPVTYWLDLTREITAAGYLALLPWGNPIEQGRAKQIVLSVGDGALLLPKLSITDMAHIIGNAGAAVAVDSGLGHLAAALSVPTISLYGATDPKLTGTHGLKQTHLVSDIACSPCLSKDCHFSGVSICYPACFGANPPAKVYELLMKTLTHAQT